jgi:hypothetical protein
LIGNISSYVQSCTNYWGIKLMSHKAIGEDY